jgi:Cu+-exporting ATPase
LQSEAERLQKGGATLSALAERRPEGLVLRALMAFADEPKPGAREALVSLRARGLRIVMISGDNRGAALAMGERLGLHPDEVMAEVLPGDKAALVAELKQGKKQPPGERGATNFSAGPPQGKMHPLGGQRTTRSGERGGTVVMVGDGVNDAPALAAADVGMAMGTGTDVAMHAAGITLMRGDLSLVEGALEISRRTVMKIRQNLFWAFAYNVAGIPLAALGYLNPVLAGAAMALSSVSVLSNALLLKRWRLKRS